MYNISEILNENFLMDVLIEAIVTDKTKSDLSGKRIITIPIAIKKITYSKSAEELILEEECSPEKAIAQYVAGRKDISNANSICMPYYPHISLLENMRILAHTNGLPIIRKSDRSLEVGEIYVLNADNNIIKRFEEKF